jgi:hypothetical protein
VFHRHHVQGCTYSRVLGPRARFLGGACLSAAVKQDLSDKELRGTEVEPKPISSPPPLKTAREVFPPAAHPVRFIEGVMCRVNDDNHFQLPRMFNPGCSIGCKPANDAFSLARTGVEHSVAVISHSISPRGQRQTMAGPFYRCSRCGAFGRF